MRRPAIRARSGKRGLKNRGERRVMEPIVLCREGGGKSWTRPRKGGSDLGAAVSANAQQGGEGGGNNQNNFLGSRRTFMNNFHAGKLREVLKEE